MTHPLEPDIYRETFTPQPVPVTPDDCWGTFTAADLERMTFRFYQLQGNHG